jgi:hypothetical protein
VTSATTAAGFAAGIAALRRRHEVWPGGPDDVLRLERKDQLVQLTDYLALLETVEGSSPSRSDLLNNARTVRRLYYSAAIGGVGPLFDLIFGTVGRSPPRAHGAVTQNLLGWLYSVGETLAGSPMTPFAGDHETPVDIAQAFVAIDFILNRPAADYLRVAIPYLPLLPTPVQQFVDQLAAIEPLGIVSWVGDLASWFVEWNTRRNDAISVGYTWSATEEEEQRQALQTVKTSVEDLLGDMDGQVMGFDADRDDSITSLKSLLTGFYIDQPVTGRGNVVRRFADFVDVAVPEIPHTGTSPGPITIGPTAKDAIVRQVTGNAFLFIAQDRVRNPPSGKSRLDGLVSTAAELLAHADVLEKIVDDFLAFLSDGLSGNDTTWSSGVLDPLADYGNYYLQPGDADGTSVYGGQRRGVTDAGKSYVATFQDRLAGLGFTSVFAPGRANRGTFDRRTQRVLRNFQGYAALPGAAMVVSSASHPSDALVTDPADSPKRYRAPSTGC